MRKKGKRPATKVAGTTFSSSTQGSKEGESVVLGTLEWHYKRGKQPTVKGHLATVNQYRIIEKTLSKNLKKVVKEREISPGILKNSHYRTYLDSKRFKLCKS